MGSKHQQVGLQGLFWLQQVILTVLQGCRHFKTKYLILMNLAYLMSWSYFTLHPVCIWCGKYDVMVVDSSQKIKEIEEFQLHPLDGEVKSYSFKTTMVSEAGAPSMSKELGQTQWYSFHKLSDITLAHKKLLPGVWLKLYIRKSLVGEDRSPVIYWSFHHIDIACLTFTLCKFL